MEQWHLFPSSSLLDEVVPVESAFRNPKWRGFPEEELFRWSNASPSSPTSESDYPGRLGRPVILDGRDKAAGKVLVVPSKQIKSYSKIARIA